MRNLSALTAIAATLSLAAAATAAAAQAPAPKSTSPSAAEPPASSGAPTSAAPAGTPPSAAPSTLDSPPSTPSANASGANTATTAGAPAGLATGMSVKDKTGAIIGEVKALKGNLATIQMGSDTFSVETNKLAVTNGAAMINATQAELKAMMPKK